MKYFRTTMKRKTKENFFELLRKTDFPDCVTYTCLNESCQGFILKLSDVIDLPFRSKKLILKANSKP